MGYKFWYVNGESHRVDGPAVEHKDGRKEWWVNNEEYTKKEFNKIINEVKNMNPAERLTDPRWWVREWKQ